jgi:hypothetical protein
MRHRSKYIVAGVVICITAGLAFLYLNYKSAPRQEILLSGEVTLKTDWQEFWPKTAMKTTSQWNELIIEVPGFHLIQEDSHFVLSDGTSIEIQGFLTKEDGETIHLDKISIVRIQDKEFIRLSSSVLEWKEREFVFRSVTLRSNGYWAMGRMVWISYDPRGTKDGVAFPKFDK